MSKSVCTVCLDCPQYMELVHFQHVLMPVCVAAVCTPVVTLPASPRSQFPSIWASAQQSSTAVTTPITPAVLQQQCPGSVSQLLPHQWDLHTQPKLFVHYYSLPVTALQAMHVIGGSSHYSPFLATGPLLVSQQVRLSMQPINQ